MSYWPQYERARALWGSWDPATTRLKELAHIEELDETLDYLRKPSNKSLPLLDDKLLFLDDYVWDKKKGCWREKRKK